MYCIKNFLNYLVIKCGTMMVCVLGRVANTFAQTQKVVMKFFAQVTKIAVISGAIIAGVIALPAAVANAQSNVVNMATAYTSIVPGGVIEFTLTAVPPPSAGTTISVTVNPSDAMGAIPAAQVLPSNTFTIDSSGSVTGWLIGRTGDDSSLGQLMLGFNVDSTSGYSSGQSVNMTYRTPTTPAGIMISGPSSSVNEEDETVTFTLSANPVANRDIAVKVNVADLADRSADYVTDGDHYVLIPANDTSATLSVPINDVPGAGLDGVIVATIQDSAGYTYSTMTNSAYADIYDTDGTTPVITVTASPSTIKAAQNAIFTFSRTGDITNSLPFSYELIDSGNVLPNQTDLLIMFNLKLENVQKESWFQLRMVFILVMLELNYEFVPHGNLLPPPIELETQVKLK